jgi:CubicO group peptidase (beta-lactamase class C family)
MVYKHNTKRILVVAQALTFSLCSLFSLQATADQVDAFIAKKMESRQILGLQLAVAKQGKVIKLADYGNMDANAQQPVTHASLFPINSMTKAFTGMLVVKLAAMNKLNLADPIGMHLDNLPSAWQTITISQILSHTSGLPSILTGNLVEMVGDGTDNGAWQQVQALPMQSEPDTKFSYNQTGYAILGKLIEKFSGQSYEEAVKSLLLGSGMTKTAQYSFQSEHNTAVSQQFIASNGSYQSLILNFPAILWPAAGMVSNAEELANFTIALQNGEYFDSAYLKSLWRPRVLSNGETAGFNDRENGYANHLS